MGTVCQTQSPGCGNHSPWPPRRLGEEAGLPAPTPHSVPSEQTSAPAPGPTRLRRAGGHAPQNTHTGPHGCARKRNGLATRRGVDVSRDALSERTPAKKRGCVLFDPTAMKSWETQTNLWRQTAGPRRPGLWGAGGAGAAGGRRGPERRDGFVVSACVKTYFKMTPATQRLHRWVLPRGSLTHVHRGTRPTCRVLLEQEVRPETRHGTPMTSDPRGSRTRDKPG